MAAEYVSLGDTVRFGITLANPSGSLPSLINADETPRWYVYTSTSGDNPLMQGNFGARANLIGTYSGVFVASTLNNFVTNDYVEVHASGKVNNIVGRQIIKTFVINDIFDVNIVKVSGTNVVLTSVIDSNVVQVSGVPVNSLLDVNVISISGVRVGVADDLYFAGIKFIKDSVVPEDEYVAQWFKNSYPLSSGAVTNAAISVYKTSDSTSLFTNKVMNYLSINHGTLRYNETTNLAVSGEPYLAVVSGTINGGTRVWTNPIGLDYL